MVRGIEFSVYSVLSCGTINLGGICLVSSGGGGQSIATSMLRIFEVGNSKFKD